MLKQILILMIIGILVQNFGCSSLEVNNLPLPNPPAYTQVPHPKGDALTDLQAIFLDSNAPKKDWIKDCDGKYKKLISLTQSKDERIEGVVELVKDDPVFYHWCFYGKMIEIEENLKQEIYVDERQKKVLEAYEFLVPIAKVFSSQFHDTRYLRATIHRYKKLSEWLFFRKLDLTAEGTVELVQPENPFGLWRDDESNYSILTKYNLLKPKAEK